MNNTHTKKNYDLYKIDLQLFANNKLISLDGLGSYLTKSKDIFYMKSDIASNEDIDQIIQKDFQIKVCVQVIINNNKEIASYFDKVSAVFVYYPNGFDDIYDEETISYENNSNYDYSEFSITGYLQVPQNKELCIEFGFNLSEEGRYEELIEDKKYQDKFLIDNSNLDYCEQMLYYNDFWGSSDGTPNVLSYRIKTNPNNLSYNEQNNYYELNINVIPFESTITP